jgi:hypothetical protein
MNTNASIGMLAASYTQLGWKLVRCYGVHEPSVCTCAKNADCGTPGKHPVGEQWDARATGDEETVMSWFEGKMPVNVGLLLGPRSGVIDIELDGPEAKAAWDALELGEIWTPTYQAGRGPHRLFKWSEKLPATSVKKPMGIEMRIGNGGKAIHSVIPPSTHHTGAMYQWIPGLSPDEVELAELPEKLVELLWNSSGPDDSRKPARLAMHEEIPNGSRNETLHRFAVREAARCGPNLDDPFEQQDLLAKVRAINLVNCKPPLPDSEVINCYRSAVAYIRKTRAAEIAPDEAVNASEQGRSIVKKAEPSDYVRTLTVEGLSFGPLVPGSDSTPEWKPGDWRLTVVHSDPLEYRLHAPAWKKWTADGTGNVSLSVDQYRSARKVAASVLAATGVVMLDAEPKRWVQIWDGGYKVVDKKDGGDKERVALGLKAKLLDNVDHEWPGASSLRYVILAGWLYDRLAQASQPSEDDVPDPSGRASWRQDGTLWFSWSKVWEDIERQHRIMEGERLSLKRRLLARFGGESRDFKHAEFRHLGGTRKSYVVWKAAEFAVLEGMANEATRDGA